jgi:WD40 repeat protein/serine/threonine protein kinase
MPESHNREVAIFSSALELSPEQRPAYLDEACAGDAALRQRVEAMLLGHERANANPPTDPRSDAADLDVALQVHLIPDEAPGNTIGRYKLLQEIGEGGFGVVYMAEQREPVHRRVALKIVKIGTDKGVIARFEAEQQALALMDHANIARVLDAGTTLKGRPYFVMELVKGVPITDFCDQNNLSTRDRLELFIKVCQAVQHAHQKGIIHRDIKPSNVLVTLHDGVPVPKVIDFGVAKAIDQRLTEKTLFTAFGQFIGTPAYMSPEQAEMSGLDVDTRSDIYSLGALLYELLTGCPPFDPEELLKVGFDEMRRTIREKEPFKPSTRLTKMVQNDLTTAAKRRQTEPPKLIHLVRGDLDWIVMKCLEKDRTRRYETANGLAVDLKRHLNDETVVARPPSSAYRFQKLVRRNKLAFAAAGAVACALFLGIIASTWQAIRATHAKREALAAQASELTQRRRAEANEQKAIEAQAAESKLREQAQAQELVARQRAYASDMNVAAQALADNNLGRTLNLLNRQRPQPGEKDLRGWEWRYLWQQTRSGALLTLCHESSEIHSLAISSDGNLLAVGNHLAGGLAVWDLRTRREVVRLATNDVATLVAFSPKDSLLAFAANAHPNKLYLFNIATRQTVAELLLDTLCINLAFANDGQTLMTATASEYRGGQVTVWHVPDGKKLASYSMEALPQSAETPFAVTADLSLAAEAIRGGGRVRIFSLSDGKELSSLAIAKQWVGALAFSPDGKTLACADRYGDFAITLWDVATGKQIGSRMPGHGAWAAQLIFSPDGKRLFSASTDQTIRIWDVVKQQCVDVLRGHRQEVWRLTVSPDGKMLMSGAKDGTVCFWDTSVSHVRPARVRIPAENVWSWTFSRDGQSLLTLDEQGRVMRWAGPDFQQGTKLLEVATNFFSSGFSAKSEFLALCWTNGMIQVWNPSQGVLVRELTTTAGKTWVDTVFADGKKLIVWYLAGNLLREFDLNTGAEMQSWSAPSEYNSSILSPDERWHVALGYLGDMVSRNLPEGSDRKSRLELTEACKFTSFSPDAKQFAAASYLGYARVWDTATWKPMATLGNFLNGVHGLNFSPDGKRLLVVSNVKEAVRLFDTESWHDVMTLESEGSGYQGVFSPDGNSIAWCSTTALYLWRAPSWEEIKAAEAKENVANGQR